MEPAAENDEYRLPEKWTRRRQEKRSLDDVAVYLSEKKRRKKFQQQASSQESTAFTVQEQTLQASMPLLQELTAFPCKNKLCKPPRRNGLPSPCKNKLCNNSSSLTKPGHQKLLSSNPRKKRFWICQQLCIQKMPPKNLFSCFPKDETRKNLWVKAIRRANWEPSKFSRLCSKHFPEDMIDRTSLSCVVKLRKLPTRAVFEPAQSRLEVHPAANEVEKVLTEVTDNSSESPTKAIYKRQVVELGNIIEKKNKKLKVLQQKVRRYEKKIQNLSELLEHLKKKNFLDDDALHVLSAVTTVNKEFISRQLANVTKLPLPQSYSPELRSFALTLNFYSPRAYDCTFNFWFVSSSS
ncbi:unnamed protein product [Larinioides sclopetarius]|uniref:THAP-type domain-containing protein n=1 Tax=Larinioides sclopetarius TaxID=280406 RepID=A0AAV2BS21_9ARAC